MFLLYNGNAGGSSEIRLRDQVHPAKAQLLLHSAARVLRLVGHQSKAAAHLEEMPFELWEATNGFGDDFDVLYMKLSVSQYLAIGRDADTYKGALFYNSIASALQEAGNPVRFIAMDADTDASADAVPTPILDTTSLAVSRALSDFDILVNSTGGSLSGLDRIHTALHGHLRVICEQASIPYAPDTDLAGLFALIRKSHPKFQSLAPPLDGIKILRGLASIVDALSPLRNRHSIAHPNEILLAEPEARLAINAAKSVLHYVDQKLL